MICKGCGAELTSIQLFCPHCGTKNEPAGEVKLKCVKCGKVFPEGINYCNACGGQLVPAQPNILPNIPVSPQPNQIPPVQPQGQMPQPRQLPPYQPQSQVPPPPRQLPPYQPQSQLSPQHANQVPPYPQKTKKSALPIIIIVGLIVVLLGGGIGAVAIYNHMAKLDKVPSFSELFNKNSSDEDKSSADDASSGDNDYNPSSGNTATDYPNYYNYIGSRAVIPFDQYTEILMENGIAFYLNDVYLTDNGNGTATVDCNMYLMSYLSNSDLYSDDFMVLPTDSMGNAVSDAVKIEAITDTSGYSLSTPVTLNSTFYTYTVSFTVPSNTTDITFYGVNIQLDSSVSGGASASGPVYYMDITFQ